MAAPYEGRLELTWTNKQLRLLAHEDGSYEWVNPSDYRVAEVRLLHDVASVGEVGKTRAADNLLIRGDALNALTTLARLPEFARQYLGKVKLVYIDPPFNTQQSFLQYDDALEHSVWLTMIRDRLLQIRDILSQDGSVWLHIDDAEVHRARSVMDEVFGPDQFVATVIWEKADSPRMDADYFSGRHDYLLVYRRSEAFSVNRVATDGVPKHYNKIDDQGRSYYLKPLRAMGPAATRKERPTMWFSLTAPDGSQVWPLRPDSIEGRWRWSQKKCSEEAKRLEWIRTDASWQPYFRIYADTDRGVPPETIWSKDEVGTNRTSKAEVKKLAPDTQAFDTPKPERLLQRIIHIASDPGDIVLDCFLGSGTTSAVAHKMGRRWVGIEREPDTIEGHALPRLSKVVAGEDPGGITEDVDWEGGGGFRILDVAPSMFEVDDGLVFLADWMINGKLSEATAAQLGFEYEPDPPFSGRKGRTRLAVVDGVVNESVVRLLTSALPEGERVVVCGTGIDTDARPILRELRPGSTLRKIPAALLDEYRSSRQLRLSLDGADAAEPSEVPS
ncbi:DNA methylase [Gaiella occulta]|uniref:DNA methylase n=1 Tax=Gaiella occulta TaxID=1002870 RepID=A0A7M2YUX9_9ACTN|nr:site-specific DNA-methyltransferase [Gaiella occulta]RDI73540.1 DNA methylase [Gaiella occulta]